MTKKLCFHNVIQVKLTINAAEIRKITDCDAILTDFLSSLHNHQIVKLDGSQVMVQVTLNVVL